MSKNDDFMAKVKMTLVDKDGTVLGYKEVEMMDDDPDFPENLKQAMESMVGDEDIESIHPVFHGDHGESCNCGHEEQPFCHFVKELKEAGELAVTVDDFAMYKEFRANHWIVDLIDRHMEKFIKEGPAGQRFNLYGLDEAKVSFYHSLIAKNFQLALVAKHSSSPNQVNSIIDLPDFPMHCADFPREEGYRNKEPVKSFLKSIDPAKLLKHNTKKGGKQFAREISKWVKKFSILDEEYCLDNAEDDNSEVFDYLHILEDVTQISLVSKIEVLENSSRTILNAFKQFDPSIQLPNLESEFKEQRKRVLAANLLNPNYGHGSIVH